MEKLPLQICALDCFKLEEEVGLSLVRLQLKQTSNNEKNERCECSRTTGKSYLKKIQALKGIRANDLCVTGAMLYQMGFESRPKPEFFEVIFPVVLCMAALASNRSFILSSFNCHCWASITLGGRYFKNFWVGVCRWDPGTLSLYQS